MRVAYRASSLAMQLAGKYYFATSSTCIEFVDKASARPSTARPNRTFDYLSSFSFIMLYGVLFILRMM